jgi:hypothetical protein
MIDGFTKKPKLVEGVFTVVLMEWNGITSKTWGLHKIIKTYLNRHAFLLVPWPNFNDTDISKDSKTYPQKLQNFQYVSWTKYYIPVSTMK